MRYSRIVCVLSGGGAKAAAHVGAIQALIEREMAPAHYVGTSMGAVMAACFASGLSYTQVLKRVTSLSRRDVAAFSPSMLLGPFAKSLLRAEPLRQTIAALVPARRFDELQVPLTVTAVDVETGALTLFGAGGRAHIPLIDALAASSSLPVYYPPQRIGDRNYVDGGMRAVLPLDVAAGFDPDLLFAVSVGPSFNATPAKRRTPLPPMVRAHSEAVRTLMAAQTEEVLARWKDSSVPLVLVEPPIEQEATFALGDTVRYVEEGYRVACWELEQWRAGGGAAIPSSS